MKKLSLLLLCCLNATIVLAADHPWTAKLPFAEATINYTLSGSENGTQTLYIKDHGNTTSTHRKSATTVFGMTNQTETVDITTPDWVYHFDLIAHAGTKSVNPIKIMIEEFNKLSPADQKKALANAQKLGTTMTQGMQGEVKRDAATLLGYKCDMVNMMGITTYTLAGSGVEMKTEGNLMGVQVKTVADSIQTGAVPADKFAPPAGITAEHDPEADAQAREMAKMSVAMMVAGENSLGAPPAMGPANKGPGKGPGAGEEPPNKEELMKMLGAPQQ